MSMGSPHCETIKIQYECRCGNIETELYSIEEQKVNELVARTSCTTNSSIRECREALETFDYDLDRAEAYLSGEGLATV